MALLGIHTGRAPWPFNRMEIGDSIICTDPRGPGTAHAYGAATKKIFKTKKITNKVTGEVGYKVTRVAEQEASAAEPKRPMTRINGELVPAKPGYPVLEHKRGIPGRKKLLWPFEKLAVGESWTTKDRELIHRVISAVSALNRTATLQYKRALRAAPEDQRKSDYLIELHSIQLYSTKTEIDPKTRFYNSVTVTKLDGAPKIRLSPAARARAERTTAPPVEVAPAPVIDITKLFEA